MKRDEGVASAVIRRSGLVGVVVVITTCVIVCGFLLHALHWPARHQSKPTSTGTSHTSQHKPSGVPAASTILASYATPITDGLITNEFTHFNAGSSLAVTAADWDMTSGSLFARGGVFWTGKPDTCTNGPNARSTNCTDSDIFRLNTTKTFAGSLKLSLALKQNADIHNANCDSNDTCWYGTHVWIRYQNPFNLYYVSLNRADGQVVIKRKVPCGSSDSGTYFVLGSYARHDFTPGVWSKYAVTVQTNADKSVTIKLYDTAVSTTTPIVIGTDRGGVNPSWSAACITPGHYSSAAYVPITASGSVGVRGDFADFEFTDLEVTAL